MRHGSPQIPGWRYVKRGGEIFRTTPDTTPDVGPNVRPSNPGRIPRTWLIVCQHGQTKTFMHYDKGSHRLDWI